MEFLARLERVAGAVERRLDRLLVRSGAPKDGARLGEAMRYATIGGGKRLRPFLLIESARLFGVKEEQALQAACALECVHCYSLVHDDLPSMDDDAMRRGRPTLHIAFDEATAILAGDALLTLGLTTLASRPAGIAPARRAAAATLVGEAIGTRGLIGGQAEDLAAESAWPADAAAALERIHLGKTAALLTASLRLGGLYAGVPPEVDARLAELGRALGLVFQIGDDLLDVEGSEGELGKTPGKDAAAAKLTFPELYGVDESRRRLEQIAETARALAAELPADAKLLHSLIDFLAERTS
jgi:geranylgeranyl pyrophosphate synthase